jgi:two-component system OmpR family response regulator
MFNILFVEDDQYLRQLMCTVLGKNGYRVFPAEDGETALDILDKEYIDLIISDIMMPRLDGYRLTQQLRAADYKLPVLMITAKDGFDAMQQGYLAGVDDYMVKPIDVEEMLLRIGALLRRARIANERRLIVGDTLLDYDSLIVTYHDMRIQLPQKEFYLLFKLISYPEQIFTRQQLMDEIWGMESETDERTVDVHINHLRERFRDNPDFALVTIRGLGYKAVRK